jgi:hypothetical protein
MRMDAAVDGGGGCRRVGSDDHADPGEISRSDAARRSSAGWEVTVGLVVGAEFDENMRSCAHA